MHWLLVPKPSEKYSVGTCYPLKKNSNTHQRKTTDTDSPLGAPCHPGTCHRGLAFPMSSLRSIIKLFPHLCLCLHPGKKLQSDIADSKMCFIPSTWKAMLLSQQEVAMAWLYKGMLLFSTPLSLKEAFQTSMFCSQINQ